MVSFLKLVEDEKWEEARKRKISNGLTAVKALKLCLDKETMPVDFIQSLFAVSYEDKCVKRWKMFMVDVWARLVVRKDPVWGLVAPVRPDASLVTLQKFLKALAGLDDRWVVPRDYWVDEMRGLIRDLWRSYLTSEGYGFALLRLKESSRDALTNVSNLDDLEKYPDLFTLWKKTELLLLAAMKRDTENPGPQWLVVHAIAELECESIVMWFALRLYSDQIHMRDQSGMLPLHYAISERQFTNTWMTLYQPPEEMRQVNDSLLSMVVGRFPEAARFPDRDKRLPLHSMFYSSRFRLREDQEEELVATVKQLIQGAPEALATRDIKTRLYPYQIAASVNAPLEAIYKLLVGNPVVLQHRKQSDIEVMYEKRIEEHANVRKELAKRTEELHKVQKENAMLKEKLAQYEEEASADPSKREREATNLDERDQKRGRHVV